MNEIVTFEVLAWVLGVSGALGATLVGGVIRYFVRQVEVLHTRVSNAGQRLDVYKLDVSEKYASVAHLKEVEGRLLSEINKLSGEIKELNATMRILTDAIGRLAPGGEGGRR